MNPYHVLGVEPGASDDEIRRAYVALARRFHPDANPGGEERMRSINEAWAVLGDRDRRAAWDRRVAPATGFVPDDPTDDPFDPRAQPDVPYRPSTPAQARRRGVLTVTPVALFAVAVVVASVGVVVDSPAMLGGAFVVFCLACLAMIAALLVAMVEARHDEG